MEGKVVILDLFGCDYRKLLDPGLIIDYIVEASKAMNMKLITAPAVIKCYSPDFCSSEEDAGYSGFAIIAESHIAVHTWPEYVKVNIDLSSCRDFDEDRLREISMKYFDAKTFHMEVVRRY